MNWLYLLLDLGSLSIPLWYSFNREVKVMQNRKKFLLSTTVVAAFFLLWDAWFTSIGVWGFNADYHLGIRLFGMPVEEWLFFFCIPYASIFIYYALAHCKPNWLLSNRLVSIICFTLLAGSLFLVISCFDRLYTLVNFSTLFITMTIGWLFGKEVLRRFFIAFLFILIPFFIVNGILTGSFITEPVVWYNDSENLNLRLGTIPVEDIGYAFSMLFLNVLLFEKLKRK